ncbi:hypothetical protein CR513_02735, partial [Mucuna pruriens]
MESDPCKLPDSIFYSQYRLANCSESAYVPTRRADPKLSNDSMCPKSVGKKQDREQKTIKTLSGQSHSESGRDGTRSPKDSIWIAFIENRERREMTQRRIETKTETNKDRNKENRDSNKN